MSLARYARLVCFVLATVLAFGATAQLAAADTCPMAKASRKYKVKIDSAPQGATVYLDRKECGAVGVTPWAGTLASGSYTIIIEMEGYEPTTKPFKVARTRKLQESFVPLVKKADPPKIDIRADADKNVFDATVFLDGQQQGKVPVILTTTPGRHQIEIRKEGFETHTQWVEVAPNERASVTPVLKEIAKAKYGTIVVEADVPGADVLIDGNKHPDATPTVISNVIEGLHVVEVQKAPAMPWKQTVQVIANQQVKVRAELQSTIGGQVGTIRVMSNVASAKVYLDGDDKGPAPVDLKDVKPGEHVIEVKAAGYETREERVTVNAGSSAVLKLDLAALAGAADEGTIKVVSPVPGAEVIIDGAPVGKVPQERKVAAGEHFVGVQLEGYKAYEEKVTVAAGQTITVSAELKSVGKLRIITNPPGAVILINGVPASGVSPLDIEIDGGTTVVRMELPGFDAVERTLNVEGGKTDTISVTLDRSAPSGDELAAERKGLSALGARTLPRGRSTVDFSGGFPYFADLRINVGAGQLKNFGFDAGVGVRSMLARTEIGLLTRFMLAERDPFSFGVFGELWWGSRLLDDSKRNGATMNAGAVASITALSNVTISVRGYFSAWSDRHCPELDGGELDGEPTDACLNYARQRGLVAGEADPEFVANNDARRMERLTGVETASPDDMFDRDGGARFLTQIAAEIALDEHWNLFFVLEGAPFQADNERALFTGLFSGTMFDRDYGSYGRAGLTYKF